MDVRVSLGQYRTDYQRISNLYLTPNRFFTRFAAVFALVFVLGVGNVLGTEEVIYTLEPAAGSNNSYTGNCDIEIDDITWNVSGNSQQLPWRIGGKSITSIDRAVYSKTAMNDAITKIELTVGAASSITVNSLKLIVASDAEFNTKIDEVSKTFAASSTISFTPSSPKTEWQTGAYYKFVFNVTVSGKNNKYVEFSKAKFYAEATPAIPFTITLMDDSQQLTEASAGSGVTLPSREGCSGYTFAGWTKSWVAEQSSWTTTAPTIIPAGSYTPAADENLYPVYTKTEGGGSSTISFTPGTETGTTSVTKNGVTCTMSTMDNASYYQIYANGSGTFSVVSGNITAISFTCTASGTSKYGPGNASADVDTYSYSGSTGSWEGSASSVTISSTAQIRMTALSITCSGGSTTYYISEPNCCEALAHINGSITLSQLANGKLQATWPTQSNTDGWATNGIQIKIYEEGNATPVVTSEALANSTTSFTANDFTPKTCTNYYATLTALHGDDASYCAGDLVSAPSANVTTAGYTYVNNSTNVNLVAALPASTCANSGADVNIQFTAAAGYRLPSTDEEIDANVSVTNAGEKDEDWSCGFANDVLTITVNPTKATGNVTITVNGILSLVPEISVSTNEIDFSEVNKGVATSTTFTVEGANLNDANITLSYDAVEGDNVFTFSKTTLTPSDYANPGIEITLTANTTTAGEYMGTITISDGNEGASDKTINVYLTVLETYTVNWYVNGSLEHTQTDVANTAYDEVPSDFSAFDDCKDGLTFIGWSETAFGSTTSAPSLANIGTKITANKDYYAVFAEGTPGSTNELLNETFTNKRTSDNSSALPSLDNFTITGKVYEGAYSTIKFGSSDYRGSITSKELDLSNAFTVRLSAKQFGSDATVIYVRVGDDTRNISTTDSLTSEFKTFTFQFEGTEETTITIGESGKRGYIDDVVVTQKVAPVWTKWYTTCPHYYTVSLTNNGVVDGKGSFVADKASALAGESVKLTATGTENAGQFNSWSITGLDSYSATTNPLTISMPNNDITVSATFDALYAITKDQQNGTITLGADYAAAGDEVTISASANPQYKNPVLTVFETGNESNTITVSAGAFTMPAYGVTARVVCEPAIEPLAAPVLGAATDATYQGVTLNWTSVVGNEGYVLTVQQGGVDVEGLVNVAIAQNATSYTIASGLAANTDYTYSIYTKGNGTTTMEVNTPANGNFSTEDYPNVTLYYSENGELSAGVSQKILTDFELADPASDPCTKKFVGWSTVTVAETDAEPAMMAPGATYQIPTNANCTLYAVYATEVPGETVYALTPATSLSEGTFVIAAYEGGDDEIFKALTGEVSSGDLVNEAIGFAIDDNKIVSLPNNACEFTFTAVTGGYSIQKPNGDYLGYTSTSDNRKLAFGEYSSLVWSATAHSKDGYPDNGLYLSTSAYRVFHNTTTISTSMIRGYKSTQAVASPIYLFKKTTSDATYSAYATTCTGKVATPSFSGITDGETYEEDKTVSLGCATGEATIRYTMSNDGTTPADPTGESTAATSISLNADGVYVIKAKAFKDGMDASDVATISVTINKPCTTIASFIAATPTNKKLVFTAESNARVLAYNKNRIYIQDGTGAMFLYNTGSNNEGHGKTWASGKKIVGTLTGTYTTSNNMPRMTVTDFGATDVTADAIELPTPIAVEALATNFASNVCKLVTISGVSIRSESVADNKTIEMTKSDVTYNIYNAFNALTSHTLPLNSTSCTVTGILGQSTSGNTLQLMPISADGISTNGAEAVLPVLSVTGSTNSAEPFEVATNKVISFTPNSNFSAVYAVNDGEETAVGNSTSVTIKDEENATKVYIKATREYYTTKEVSYYYRANSALIEYDITKGAMSHGSATIQNAQGDAITYAVGGATVTLVANPAEHYHWVSWEVTAGGEPVTVTNNTFEMPNAAVTVSATFEEDDYATVAFAKGNAGVTGDAPASQKVYVGENATMPGKGSMILSSHNFAGWKLGSNAVLNTGDAYTVTAADHEAGTITFEAQWEPYPWASAGKWELVTSASEITVNPTTYVIFADTLPSGNTACGLTQNDNNRAAVSVTKTDNLLTWTGADPAIFIVEEGKDESTFAFYDAINNNYIHAESNTKNYLHSNTDKNTDGAAWTIDAIRPNGGATVTADTYTHNLLNLNGNICAAYTAPQKGLAIYKFVGGSYYNIVYAKGTEDVVRNMPEGHVTDENGEAAIKENTPIRVGYTFTGWEDQDENVYTYNDGQIYTFTKNVTLTAQWEEQTDKYTVSYDANGSSDAVPAEAAYFENAEVTVAGAVSKEGFVFMGWECNGRVYTAGSKFYMPATDMPMVAKYAHGATYDNMTKVNNVCSIESHDAPEGSEAVFTNSYTTAKQITKNNSMTLTLSGYTGYTIEGVKLSTGSNNTSGQGTLSITIGGVEVATDANADKWYNGVHHYGSNNGTDFENVLVSMNPKTVKYGEDIVITIAASESSLYCQSFTILYDLLPVEVENTTTIEARDLAAGTEVTIHDGGTLNVNANKSLDNLIIEAGGEVSGASALTVNNLTINSEAGKSGQVMNENVTVNGDIYLEIKLDKSGTMDPHKYYCISAPFDVAALEWGNGTPMVFNVDYQLFIYDGDKRARTGNGWQRVGGTIEKNSAYFIGFDDENTNNQNIIRLKAANKAIPTATSIELEEHPATYGQDESEIAKNSNWNGLGNPRLNYVNLNKNVSVYEAEEERFDTYAEELANGFVVGTAFFVQGTGNLTFENEAHGAYRAPKRESEHYMYCVEIAQENASRYDNRLYVMASETASTSFEEGKDLPTLNSETSKYGALIWTKNYGMRLVIEETPMVNNKASYELGIFAPANGTYRIETPTVREDADLYLTYEGAIIWDLSMGAYEAELAKGQNEGYGLLLVKKMPMTPTGVDEVQSDKVQCTKVVIDEHVYILRGGEMYDVTGKAVK